MNRDALEGESMADRKESGQIRPCGKKLSWHASLIRSRLVHAQTEQQEASAVKHFAGYSALYTISLLYHLYLTPIFQTP